jgi:hypothetical protein
MSEAQLGNRLKRKAETRERQNGAAKDQSSLDSGVVHFGQIAEGSPFLRA